MTRKNVESLSRLEQLLEAREQHDFMKIFMYRIMTGKAVVHDYGSNIFVNH